jgi:hypothetical protein
MTRQLTKKQRNFISAYIDSGIGVKAAMQAYDVSSYASANSIATQNLQNSSIRAAIDRAWRQKNLTPERFAETISDALSAETEMIVGPGKTVSRPDHATRLKAVDLAAKLGDAYPKDASSTHEHRHLHLETSEPSEMLRFKVIHGRAPTERELKELIPESSSPDETPDKTQDEN